MGLPPVIHFHRNVKAHAVVFINTYNVQAIIADGYKIIFQSGSIPQIFRFEDSVSTLNHNPANSFITQNI